MATAEIERRNVVSLSLTKQDLCMCTINAGSLCTSINSPRARGLKCRVSNREKPVSERRVTLLVNES